MSTALSARRAPLFAGEGRSLTVVAMNVRVAKCLLLSKILVADGMVTENERAFLDRSMKDLGLTEEERRSVVALEGLSEAEDALVSIGPDEKSELMEWLLAAASADSRLSPLEAAELKRITAALGL